MPLLESTAESTARVLQSTDGSQDNAAEYSTGCHNGASAHRLIFRAASFQTVVHTYERTQGVAYSPGAAEHSLVQSSGEPVC